MQPAPRHFLSAALVLAAVFSAVHLRLAYPPPPKPVMVRHLGIPHMLLPDSVVFGFLRELLAQSDAKESREDIEGPVHFSVSPLLVEHDVIPLYSKTALDSDTGFPYGTLPTGLLRQMHQQKLVTTLDTLHMQLQVEYSRGFGLEQRHVPSRYTVLPADSIRRFFDRLRYSYRVDSLLEKRYGTATYTHFSCPIFSVDKRIVIVSVDGHCGALCGGGATYVLQRRKGKWYKLLIVEKWVS